MFTKRNLFVLFGKHAIIAVTAIGVAVLSVWFISREIARVSDTVVKNRQLAEKLGHRTELFSVLARDVDIVGTNDKAIEYAFPLAESLPEFIVVLENLASKNATTQAFHLVSFAPAPQSAPFPLSAIEYQNSMVFNIYSFIKYLKDFESLPYFTKINSLSFTSQGSTGWRGAGSASYSATLYTKTNQ